MDEGIINLDAMRPKKKIIKVAGKNLDVTNISFGTMLDMIDKMGRMGTDKSSMKNRKMLETFGEIVDDILKRADEEIDDKWIKENINGYMRMRLINEVVTPLMDGVTDSATPKKK